VFVGCTSQAPSFETLGEENIPQPTFSGQTTLTITTSLATYEAPINGECDPKVQSLLGMVTATMTTMSTMELALAKNGTSSVTCSADGKFSFTLKNLTDLGIAAPIYGTTYVMHLRSVTSGGFSRPSYINIRYQAPESKMPILISSGGIKGGGATAGVASNPTFAAQIRVHNRSSATPTGNNLKTVSQSPNFVIKIGQ